MTGSPSENPGFDRSEFVPYSGGDLKLENLPLIEGDNLEEVADALIALPKLPEADLLMQRYSVAELGQILEALMAKDADLKANLEAQGVKDTYFQRLSKTVEGSGVEKAATQHARSALESLKADLSKGADAAADTTSAEALQAGVDAGVEADEAVDGMVGEFTEIFEGDGDFSGKFSEASKLAQKYGKEAQGAFKEAKKAMREVYAEEEGPFALVVALAKFAEVFFDGMSSRREKRKGKEKKDTPKEAKEKLKGFHPLCDAFGIDGTLKVTSPWGPRPTPKGLLKGGPQTKEWHNGVDFRGKPGTEIRAFQDCEIKQTGRSNAIWLKDSNGRVYTLTHVNIASVTGEAGVDGWIKKSAGDLIVEVGAEDGTSDGAHLDVRRKDGGNPLEGGYFAAAVLEQNKVQTDRNKERIAKHEKTSKLALASRAGHANDQTYFDRYADQFPS